MAITFDGPNLRIILDPGVTTLDAEDLYSRWKDWAKLSNNSRFPFAFADSFGGNTLDDPLEAAPYFTLRNDFGWRIRPSEENINVLVTGNLVAVRSDLGVTGIIVPTLGTFTTAVIGLQPVTQFIETGGSGLTGAESVQLFAVGTPPENADAVWDEPLTGSSHNIPTSSGRRLRQLEEAFVHSSGVIAAVTDGHTFILDSGAVAIDGYYVGDRLQISEGAGAGQSRVVVAYSASRVVVLDSDFAVNPDTDSLWELAAADVHVSVSDADLAEGFVAVADSLTQVTLDDTTAIAVDDYYNGSIIIFTHGTGAGQSREIIDYTSGRLLTMNPPLEVAVSTDTTWHIMAAVSAAEIATEVWTRVLEGALTNEQALRIILSALTGLSTATQGPNRFRTRDIADTKDRVDGLHSDDGDRTSVTLDGS